MFLNVFVWLLNVIRYFSDESTQEMLEEWRPLLCPFDVTVIRGLTYYEFFLPSLLPPEKHHLGFKYVQNSLLTDDLQMKSLGHKMAVKTIYLEKYLIFKIFYRHSC